MSRFFDISFIGTFLNFVEDAIPEDTSFDSFETYHRVLHLSSKFLKSIDELRDGYFLFEFGGEVGGEVLNSLDRLSIFGC